MDLIPLSFISLTYTMIIAAYFKDASLAMNL